MYADDVVLLANNANELGSRKIATDFARLNRFQYNGEKSAVMVFNVDGKTVWCASRVEGVLPIPGHGDAKQHVGLGGPMSELSPPKHGSGPRTCSGYASTTRASVLGRR